MKRCISFCKKFNFLLLIILVLLIGMRIYISDKVATEGSNLSRLEEDLTSLEKENQGLNNKLYAKTSLNTVKEKAIEEGYVSGQVDYFIPFELASR